MDKDSPLARSAQATVMAALYRKLWYKLHDYSCGSQGASFQLNASMRRSVENCANCPASVPYTGDFSTDTDVQ